MISGNFGRNFTNPRETRAFAHAKLVELTDGETSANNAREAVMAAIGTKAGEQSGFETRMRNIQLADVASRILFIDWTGGFTERPAYGGYIIPTTEVAELWEDRHTRAVQGRSSTFHRAYNAIHEQRYATATIRLPSTIEHPPEWGKSYDLNNLPLEADISIDARS